MIFMGKNRSNKISLVYDHRQIKTRLNRVACICTCRCHHRILFRNLGQIRSRNRSFILDNNWLTMYPWNSSFSLCFYSFQGWMSLLKNLFYKWEFSSIIARARRMKIVIIDAFLELFFFISFMCISDRMSKQSWINHLVSTCVCGLNGNSVYYCIHLDRRKRLLHVTYRLHRLLFFSRTLLLYPSRTFISNRTVMIIRVRLTLSRDDGLTWHALPCFAIFYSVQSINWTNWMTREEEKTSLNSLSYRQIHKRPLFIKWSS